MIKKLAISSTALLALLLCATPVNAYNYTPVSGTTSRFEKVINLDENAHVPNVNYTYTVAAGTPKAPSEKNLPVYAGNDPMRTNGQMPTVSEIKFKASDAHDGDDATRVTKAASVDFAGVTYNEPGVYRYVITESGNSQAIQEDADRTRALDVYVQDVNGTLQINGYIFHTDETADAVKDSTQLMQADKSTGYEATYVTHDLEINKTVAGNQASHDEYFAFTVDIDDAVPETVYTVDLANAEATTSINGASHEAHQNADSLTIGADGTLHTTYWLQHNQKIKILGLAEGTTYTVTEANQDYVVTNTRFENDTTGTVSQSATASDEDGITNDSIVKYINRKEGVIPTGLSVKYAPYIIGTAGGIALIAAILIRKKKNKNK